MVQWKEWADKILSEISLLLRNGLITRLKEFDERLDHHRDILQDHLDLIHNANIQIREIHRRLNEYDHVPGRVKPDIDPGIYTANIKNVPGNKFYIEIQATGEWRALSSVNLICNKDNYELGPKLEPPQETTWIPKIGDAVYYENHMGERITTTVKDLPLHVDVHHKIHSSGAMHIKLSQLKPVNPTETGETKETP